MTQEMSDGIFVLDKPAGMSSQSAATRVRKALGAARAGHGGTLDPDATGVLPIFLGKATRLSEYLLDAGKEYSATLAFGTATDTQDASGRVVASGDPRGLRDQAVRDAFAAFRGWILQTPPAYSALKVGGRPAYERARAGEAVSLAPRQVYVDQIQVDEISLGPEDFTVDFRIECGKGLYVRTLCHDIGAALAVPAHMRRLRRTRSGPFGIASAHSLEDAAARGTELLLPPEAAVPHLPRVDANPDAQRRIRHGERALVPAREDLFEGQLVRAHGSDGRLLAICLAGEESGPHRVLIAKKVLV